MPKAVVTITINPAFTDPETPPIGGHPPKVILPFAMAESYDQAGRIKVTSPTGPGSSQPGNPGDPYVDGSIVVSGNGNISLSIVVNDTVTPTPNVYTVCGMVFSLPISIGAEALRPAPGRDTFPSFRCAEDGSVELEDAHTALKTYNFLLLIQNYQGGIAIIDPLISNQ